MASTNNSCTDIQEVKYFESRPSYEQLITDDTQMKKNSYFSIEREEKIEKFMDKLQRMLCKTLYGESSSEEGEEEQEAAN